MKTWILSALLVASASAHTIFQKLSIDGVEQGSLVGVRAPNSNNPIQNVNTDGISCNTGIRNTNAVVKVPAGARVGAWWQHVIGGPQMPGDPDNPIAKSHKGPALAYLAPVSNAGSSATTGLKWFKIYHDGMDSSFQWGVDRMVKSNGWQYFQIPSCVPPGQYLLRAELIALHSAYSAGGAQFYMSCANIEITGNGTKTPTSFVSFPGAYKTADPGIQVSIYDKAGNTNMNGGQYTIPGPAPYTC